MKMDLNKRKNIEIVEHSLPKALKTNDSPKVSKHNELNMNKKDHLESISNVWSAALNHISNQKLIELIEELLNHGDTVSKKNRLVRTQFYGAISPNESGKYTFGVNTKSVSGCTLHVALCRYYLEVVDKLLKHGCDVNVKDDNGKTPLHYAFEKIHSMGTIEKIINVGAYVNAEDNDRKTPLHYMLENGYDVEDIEKFLKYKIDVNVKDKKGKTPLHCLIQNNDLKKTIAVMVDAGANINAKDQHQRTPLHYMLINGYSLETIKEMLCLGADVRAVDKNGKCVLHLALPKCNVEVIRELLKFGADVNYKDKYEMTPLNYATFTKCSHENIKELLSNHMIDVNTKDINGRTPLHFAASGCDLKSIQEILNFGGDINAKDYLGMEPLQEALLYFRSKEIITVMLKHGASVHNIVKYGIEHTDIVNREIIKYSLLEDMSCNNSMIFHKNSMIRIDIYNHYILSCIRELQKMKKSCIIGERNLYDFVQQKCDYGKFVSKNIDVLLSFKRNPQRLMEIFPIYHDVVMDRLKTRTYLLRKLDDLSIFIAVNQHKVININPYCVKMIASYLPLAHLNNFYEAVCSG